MSPDPHFISPQVPADALNALLADKEKLKSVLLRHVVTGCALQGKNIPPGTTNLKTAGGEEIGRGEREAERLALASAEEVQRALGIAEHMSGVRAEAEPSAQRSFAGSGCGV